ncbi:MAG: MarR family transcriptional regulator [Saprospiraceae bacterium]|nr:MarR family transcriptional regulator [Saprospiraceae bacterium]
MKLEQELKSTKPMPARQRATLNILFTASWLDCAMTRQLRPFGLTPPQYNILRILNGSAPKGLSVLDIKSRMLDRSSNVSRLVEKLRLADLAERVPHGKDRRMVVVTISEKGKKMLADIEHARFMEGADVVAAKLSEAELLELAHLLDKFRE